LRNSNRRRSGKLRRHKKIGHPHRKKRLPPKKKNLKIKLLSSKNNHWNTSDLKEIRSFASDISVTDWKPCWRTRISISRILKISKEISKNPSKMILAP
jgi:hypothetical protein